MFYFYAILQFETEMKQLKMVFTILKFTLKGSKIDLKKKKTQKTLGSACRKNLKPVYGAEENEISMSISLSDAQKINKDLLLRVFINNTS